MTSEWGEDDKRVEGGWKVGRESDVGWRRVGWRKVGVVAREKPMVRWCRGMAHHCPAPHGHGIATSGVHMGIIVKFGEALPCVKSPFSRTSGTIYVVT